MPVGHSRAAESFEEAGGAVDISVGSYMPCNGDGCYDEAFSEMVPALSSTVQRYVDQGMYSTGRDRDSVCRI